MRFAVIGGDMRQAELIRALQEDGHEIKAYGLEKTDGISCAESLAGTVGSMQYIILPLPTTLKNEKILNAPYSAREISIKEVFDAIVPGQMIFSGRNSGYIETLAENFGAELVDYSAREEFAVLNANATAEGAVQILLQELPAMLADSKCLVIGFGRIGKLLAYKLKALGADVSVSARKYSDKAWAESYGYHAEDTRRLGAGLCKYDAIINTVPALVLNEERIRNVRGLCLDLASMPGGIDFEAASRTGIKAIHALSLPGKTAPESAARIIKNTIYNIVSEQERAN